MKKLYFSLWIFFLAGGLVWNCSSDGIEPGEMLKDGGNPNRLDAKEIPEKNGGSDSSVNSDSDGGGERKAGDSAPPLFQGPLTKYVDPSIGSGGIGFGVGSAFPGATLPFGMVKVGPDTASKDRGVPFYHCAGYYYYDREIYGFSQIHLHGTGVPDYGNLLLMPISERVSNENIREERYRSSFRHQTEVFEPGYYAVTLDRWGVRVELTATLRTAYHRYTFPPGSEDRTVLIRLDHALPGGEVSDAFVKFTGQQELSGFIHSKGRFSVRYGGYKLYFVIISRHPFERFGTWKDGKLSGEKSQRGAAIGAWISFSEKSTPVELQIGLSFVDIDGARKNLLKEGSSWDFFSVRKNAKNAWEKVLGRIKIAGGTEKLRKIFYTALYHSLLMPTLLTDVDGRYRGLDQKVHRAVGFNYYSDFSLWDTYRTLHPLLTLVYPDYQLDFLRSLVAMARDGGELPRWPMATGYSHSMVGESAAIVIADSYLKGIRNFDVQTAYDSMRRLAIGPPKKGSKYRGRSDIQHYVKKGYVSADKTSGAASITLEYAYNDFAIAQLARALGKSSDAQLFGRRAKNYRNIWDDEKKFFRAKLRDGSWLPGFNPLAWTKDYVEGNAWQYVWFVPHDPDGLAELFGGKGGALAKLEQFFRLSLQEDKNPPKTNLRKYYWHSNEPDIHAATLFLLWGKPNESRRWVRWITSRFYDDTPDGIPGNDDGGTLSAWYVFSALGLYPVPARSHYLLLAPLFPRISVDTGKNRFEIRAPGASSKSWKVRRILLNGSELKGSTIEHSTLVGGNTVLTWEFED